MQAAKNKQAKQQAMYTLTLMGFSDREIKSIAEYPEHVFFQRSVSIVGILFVVVFAGSTVAYIFALLNIRHWLMGIRTQGLDYLSYEATDIFHVIPLFFTIILATVLFCYVLRDLACHVFLKLRINPQRARPGAVGRLCLFIGRFVYFQLLERGRRGAPKPGQTIREYSLYTLIPLLLTVPVAALDFSNYVLITEHKITRRGYASIATDTFDFADVVKVETLCEDYYVRGIQKTSTRYAVHFNNGYEVNLFNHVDQEKIAKLLKIDQRVFESNPNASLVVKQLDQDCVEYLRDTYNDQFAALARLLRIQGG